MDNDNKCENESENTTVNNETTNVESENNTMDSENTTVDSENTTVDNETTNVESENNTVDSENNTVDSETTIGENESENTNVESENTKVDGKSNKNKTSKKKEEKPKFEGICSHCSKLFKNNKLYEKHTNEQVCYKENEITYCKLCQINCNNHNDYKKHLFTLEHINNIGCNTIEKIQHNTISTVHTLDPYLNNNDIAKIATKNLGNSFTFVYEKGNTQTITLKQNLQQKQDTTNNEIQNNSINKNHFNTQNSFNTINNIISPEKIDTIEINTQSPEPTLRQTKIINFLILQTKTNKPIDESGKLFYKMLDDKLRIEDYKGLQRIIKHLDINEEYKNNYLNTVDIFIKVLVKETTMGKSVYKDKHISELVINLTS